MTISARVIIGAIHRREAIIVELVCKEARASPDIIRLAQRIVDKRRQRKADEPVRVSVTELSQISDATIEKDQI